MNEPLLELLYTAFHSEVGIVVETNDPNLLRQKLYAVRKQDADLQVLSFLTSPDKPAGELWIVKNVRRIEETHAEPS